MPFDERRQGRGGGGGRPYSTDDLAAVAFFLRSAEEHRQIWGGRTATEAFDAFCRIVQLPANEFRSVIDGPAAGDSREQN